MVSEVLQLVAHHHLLLTKLCSFLNIPRAMTKNAFDDLLLFAYYDYYYLSY